MTQFSLALIWCVLQTSLVALISVMLAISIGRRYRGATRVITFWGLSGMLLLTVVAYSPWPRWDWSPLLARQSATEQKEGAAEDKLVFGTPETLSPREQASANTTEESSNGTQPPSTFVDTEISVWSEFIDELDASVFVAEEARSHYWVNRLGWFLLICAGIGLVRFGFGFVGLRRLISSAQPIQDEELLAHLAKVKREIGSVKELQVLCSTELSTAATVGWMRPILLLPPSWRSWTNQERQSVLAHEIAHIHRGDFFVASVAQLCLALHFYHPLVHWLVRRLRLEMEFDADSLAAESVGSAPGYATTLASMAIREDETKLGWPARSFLPTRNTFMRRLEMLRKTQRFPARSPVLAQWFCIAALAVSITSAIGLRASTGLEEILPESTESEAPNSTKLTSIKLDDAPLSYVPKDADAILTLKPAELTQIEAISDLVKLAIGDGMKGMGIPFEASEVTRLTTYLTQTQLVTSGPTVWIASLREPQAKIVLDEQAEEKTFLLHKYHVGRRFAWMQPDEHTLIAGPEEQIKLLIVNGPDVNHPTVEAESWKAVEDAQAAIFMNTDVIRVITDEAPLPPWMTAFAPLWTDADSYVAGIKWEDSLSIIGNAQCPDGESAESVKQTVESVLTLAKNAVRQLRVAEDEDAVEAAMLRQLAETLGSLIASADTVASANEVSMTANVEIDREVVAMLSEATLAARKAASRTQDMNNLKQIMLAMHNYHDVHKRLPPAVVYHKTESGELVPHSWRIELLPYLEGQHLYEAYRMDEPWDSEHNMTILEQMPPVYRATADDQDSTNSSYFVIVSERGMFSIEEGTRFRDVTDGLSNTIAVVEAKREIPWTKPVDLEFDADADELNFGGWQTRGFLAGLGDGSVRFFEDSIDLRVLGNLIGMNDGRAVNWERELSRPRSTTIRDRPVGR